jgi:hypothetical protein
MAFLISWPSAGLMARAAMCSSQPNSSPSSSKIALPPASIT